MKHIIRIILVIIFMSLCLWGFGQNIDQLPFHFADLIVAMFAFGGVLYLAELSTEYIFELIECLKQKKLK